MSAQPPTAALLIIGNEILSGRTQEKNLPVLARMLGERGIRLREARVAPDIEDEIVCALNALRARHNFVFTSGGIGPTHDDITTDAVARAFGEPATENAAAVAQLAAFYKARNMEFTPARRRMARMPRGATPIKSEFPGAPAYVVGNVYVCAGVPAIFANMAAGAMALLPRAAAWRSVALRVLCGESVFAEALAKVAAANPQAEIGSYPRDDNGKFHCQVVFSAADDAAIAAAKAGFIAALRRDNLPFEEL